MENDDLSAFLIPETLDEPEKILFFTYTELNLFMLPFIIGITTNYTIRGLLAGIGLLILYKKIKPRDKGFSIQHLVYWYFPSWLFKLTCLPSSSIRIFI